MAGRAAPHDEKEVSEVRVAAFRYMFKHNASAGQQTVSAYCIGIGDNDPPAEFLARLRDVRPTVKPLSACSASASAGVIDKSTGKRGLMFRVDEEIRWVNADHAEIDGGYYEAGLSASGNTYFAQRKNGHWVVLKDVMHWIS